MFSKYAGAVRIDALLKELISENLLSLMEEGGGVDSGLRIGVRLPDNIADCKLDSIVS